MLSTYKKIALAAIIGLTGASITSSNLHAREYFLVIHTSNATGFSSKGECERHSTSSAGCRLGLAAKYCQGKDVFVNNRVADAMVKNYQAKRTIIVRYKNANGSFGNKICSFN